MTQSVAAIFVCRQPSAYVRAVAQALKAARPSLDVSIISDRANVRPQAPVPEIFLSDEVCREAGFQWTNYMDKSFSGWDRAFCHATAIDSDYCWFIEDDVVFRDPLALLALIDHYAGSDSDVLCGEFFDMEGDPGWEHWHTVAEFFPAVVAAHAFIPLCRLSRPVLRGIAEIAARHGKLCFVESMVGSLVKALHLRAEAFDKAVARVHYRPVFTRAAAQLLLDSGVLAVHPCKEILDG